MTTTTHLNNECSLPDCFCHVAQRLERARSDGESAVRSSELEVVVAPTFTEEWESAPRAMIRYVEQDRLRAVLFDVIDGGCTCDSGEQHPWELDDDPNDPEMTEDIVNAQRVRFVDEVMGRLLISPSIAEYWFLRGVRAGETGAMVTMNQDLREIRRVAGERLTSAIREER